MKIVKETENHDKEGQPGFPLSIDGFNIVIISRGDDDTQNSLSINTPSFDDFKHITLVHEFGLSYGKSQQKEFNEEDELLTKEYEA